MRLLLVEDDPRLAKAVSQGLRESGYVVDIAGDGEHGVGMARLEAYDLVVLDWMLPGLSGIEVCRRLRASGYQTPILLLTARDDVEDRVKGLDSGADDYLVKPFALNELQARLRALLRRGEGASRNISRSILIGTSSSRTGSSPPRAISSRSGTGTPRLFSRI